MQKDLVISDSLKARLVSAWKILFGRKYLLVTKTEKGAWRIANGFDLNKEITVSSKSFYLH
jgi:hypothetical protein